MTAPFRPKDAVREALDAAATVLIATEWVAPEAVAVLAAALDLPVPTQAVDPAAEIARIRAGGMRALVLLPEPETALALGLKEMDAAPALAAWFTSASALLAAQKQARRQILLLNPCLVADPDGLAALAGRLDLLTPGSTPRPTPGPAPSVAASTLPAGLLLAARALIAADACARDLAAELSAATLAPGTAPDPRETAVALAERMKAEATPPDNAGLEAERDELRTLFEASEATCLNQEEDLAALRAEAELLKENIRLHLAQNLAQTDEADQLRRDLEAAGVEIATAAPVHAALKAEHDRLREHLRTKKAAASLRERELAALRAEAARRERLVQDLQAELTRIHASKSWKLTEPMREVRRRFGG